MLQELIQPRCSGWHSHEASLWTCRCGSASVAGWCTGAHCPGWFVQTGLCAKQCPRAGAVSVPGCLVQPHEPAAQMVTTSSGEQISKSTCLPSPTESVGSGEPIKGAVLTTGLEVAIILAADSSEPGQTASDTSQKPVSEELSSALLTQPFHQVCLDVSTSPAAQHGQELGSCPTRVLQLANHCS